MRSQKKPRRTLRRMFCKVRPGCIEGLGEALVDEPVARKAFKDYEPGFVHIDIKYLPQMPDESERSYLFVAIDRATRWVHIGIYADQTEASAVHFLEQLHLASPMKIVKLLTDNDAQFTDRFTSQARAPTGRHTFDVRCITSHPFRPSKPGGPSRLTSSRNRFMISRVLTTIWVGLRSRLRKIHFKPAPGTDLSFAGTTL